MRKVDIRAYKNSLRDKAKAMRRGMDPEEKAQMDRQITDRICSLYQYREAQKKSGPESEPEQKKKDKQ